MFGLLNSSQIYGLDEHGHQKSIAITTTAISKQQRRNNNYYDNNGNHKKQQQQYRSVSTISDTLKEKRCFAPVTSMQKSTNLIERFLKSTELLSSYDNIRNYVQPQQHATGNNNNNSARDVHAESGLLHSFNCLQGSYRSNLDTEFNEAISVSRQQPPQQPCRNQQSNTMTVKCSKNLLASPASTPAPATLHNYQKLPDFAHELQQHANNSSSSAATTTSSSGASSGEFNAHGLSNAASNLYKKLSFGSRTCKQFDVNARGCNNYSNDVASDHSSSSANAYAVLSMSSKTIDLQRNSSTSSGDGGALKSIMKPSAQSSCHMPSTSTTTMITTTPERAQRRKLMQMISNYDQQNKLLQRELAKEKRRRTEELACVVKSLLCFESKLRADMKTANSRLLEKDTEICRLVRQNRALRKRLFQQQLAESDEGVVVEDGVDVATDADCTQLLTQEGAADCLVLEALQCINCRKQFYDIELSECWSQTSAMDGNRKQDEHTNAERNGFSSSDDTTVSSSFYGARRSVRYTSKRTSGTFRDYMRSRSMNIDDAALEQNSEENMSTISRDSQTSTYEKINMYSRTIERMHGVKCNSEREPELSSDGHGVQTEATPIQIDEDDGIFSPTQDDDDDDEFKKELVRRRSSGAGSVAVKIGTRRRSAEFSEASPQQLYETSTDDWYASVSDQEEHGPAATKAFGHHVAAGNPVLECVNQILLQQSLEEPVPERMLKTPPNKQQPPSQQKPATPKTPTQPPTTNLPRRSSLSDRRSSRSNSLSSDGQNSRSGTLPRKRVHFSMKNSTVHVPRNDDGNDGDGGDSSSSLISSIQQQKQQQLYYPMNYCPPSPQQLAEHERLEALNYESIYSNEYEPIGSEHNDYVDMEASSKHDGAAIPTTSASNMCATPTDGKLAKLPPALPPKPANLLKFKKSLQQLDELPDDEVADEVASSMVASEPDYCSISEVNVGMTSVQIVADVHKAPASPPAVIEPADAAVTAAGSLCAKIETDCSEEVLANIPKLPNVAAILVPKSNAKQHGDYLAMTPKRVTVPPPLNLKSLPAHVSQQLLGTTTKLNNNNKKATSKGLDGSTLLRLQLNVVGMGQQQFTQPHYKGKHLPNILAEINKRISQPSFLTTSTKLMTPPTKVAKPATAATAPPTPAALLKHLGETASTSPALPLQAEFDWYNLDAEYGPVVGTLHHVANVESHDGPKMLPEIHEDHENIDEYNLDEEFSLASENDILLMAVNEEEEEQEPQHYNYYCKAEPKAMHLPLYCANAPLPVVLNSSASTITIPANVPPHAKAKKMKKNLANFEKFIEGSGMSTKPLSRRKIYFAGPV